MILPKPIYESLPYAYLLSALSILFSLSSPLAYLSSAIFYSCGALLWVKRSVYRRQNQPQFSEQEKAIRKARNRKSIFLPEAVYELLPFAYIGSGAVVVLLFPSASSYFLALLLITLGLLMLALRALNRKQA